MSRHKLTAAALALGLTGCVINGKKVFDLGGTSSITEPAAEAAPAAAAHDDAAAGAVAPASTAVRRGAPAWCAKAGDLSGTVDNALDPDEIDRALPGIVGVLCNPSGDAQRAALSKIEARRQDWMKRLAMTEADWANDVVEWAQIPYGRRADAQIRLTAPRWQTSGPVEQFAMLTEWADGKGHYLADALPLTQAGRVAYLLECTRTRFDTEQRPIDWAACEPDVAKIDAQALSKELRADKSSTAADRMIVRRGLIELMGRLPKFRAAVAQLREAPGFAAMFQAADKARAAWQARGKQEAELRALVAALEDASSIEAAPPDGCRDQSREALAHAVRARRAAFAGLRPPTNDALIPSVMQILASDPEGYLAMTAYLECEREAPLAYVFATYLADRSGYRGPRTSAVSAMILAGPVEDMNSRIFKFKVDYRVSPKIDKRIRGGSGEIASVKKVDDLAIVEFPAASHSEMECEHWVETNRVNQITPSGQIIYRQRCTRERKVRVDDTPKPINVYARDAAGLHRGAYLVAEMGRVVAVWDDVAAAPTAVLGVELK